jgi:hypothetical protein
MQRIKVAGRARVAYQLEMGYGCFDQRGDRITDLHLLKKDFA